MLGDAIEIAWETLGAVDEGCSAANTDLTA